MSLIEEAIIEVLSKSDKKENYLDDVRKYLTGSDLEYATNKFNEINNCSEEEQIKAIKQEIGLFPMIENPSKNVQLAAVEQDGSYIENIKTPSEEVQIAAINSPKGGWLAVRNILIRGRRGWKISKKVREAMANKRTSNPNSDNIYESIDQVIPNVLFKHTLSESEGNFQELKAYAGSRVDYNKPSLKAIGSGEGNQAHGWGLYYALDPDVAEGYRKRFSDETIYFKGKQILNTDSDNVGSDFWVFYNIRQKGIENAIKYYKEGIDIFETAIKNYPNDEYAKKELENYKEGLKKINSLTEDDIKELTEVRGQVHEVDIPEMDVLLDEQKSFDEQSDFVKNALDSIDIKNYPTFANAILNGKTGKEIYNSLIIDFDAINERKEIRNAQPDKQASQLLDKYGIKGITYDGRQDGRCFVIFNPKNVTLLRKRY